MSHESSTAQTSTAPGGITTVVPPGGGRTLTAYGDTLQLMLAGSQSNGAVTVALNSTPPHHGPPPHIHHHEDEMFLVVEGHFRYLKADGVWSEPIGPGGVAYTPRGVRHTFQNADDTPSRQWIILTPSGFESFFAQSAEVFAAAEAAGGAPDMARIVDISTAHGIEYVPLLDAGPAAAAGTAGGGVRRRDAGCGMRAVVSGARGHPSSSRVLF